MCFTPHAAFSTPMVYFEPHDHFGDPQSRGLYVAISLDATYLWKASATRVGVWVKVWAGARVCIQSEAMVLMVLHGRGDEQACLRSLAV